MKGLALSLIFIILICLLSKNNTTRTIKQTVNEPFYNVANSSLQDWAIGNNGQRISQGDPFQFRTEAFVDYWTRTSPQFIGTKTNWVQKQGNTPWVRRYEDEQWTRGLRDGWIKNYPGQSGRKAANGEPVKELPENDQYDFNRVKANYNQNINWNNWQATAVPHDKDEYSKNVKLSKTQPAFAPPSNIDWDNWQGALIPKEQEQPSYWPRYTGINWREQMRGEGRHRINRGGWIDTWVTPREDKYLQRRLGRDYGRDLYNVDDYRFGGGLRRGGADIIGRTFTNRPTWW